MSNIFMRLLFLNRYLNHFKFSSKCIVWINKISVDMVVRNKNQRPMRHNAHLSEQL